MNNIDDKSIVPSLRFEDFNQSGEWQSINFYDLLTDVIDFRGRTPKKLGMDWGGGNVVSLSANNVKNGYIDLEAECKYGSEELYQKWMGEVSLKKGDIVFTMEAPLGKATIVPDSEKYILSQRVVAFKTKENVINEFLIQLLWSDNFQSKIKLLSTGSTAKGINQKTLKTVDVYLPKNKIEQQKIANFLSSIYELVTAESEKLETLITYKKGLMQQLFPAEGESVPKLRFPEFRSDGSWSEGCVDDLANLTMGNAFKSSDFCEDGIQLIRMGNLYSGILQLGRAPIFLPRSFEESNYKFVIKPLDLLMSMTGTVGRRDYGFVVQVPADSPNLMLNQRVVKFIPKSKFVKEFILQLLKSDVFLKNLYSLPGGTKQANLSGAQLKSIEIKFPEKVEQQKIADCLSSIDELISAQRSKIEALKNYKNGLSQQLFPKEGRGK